MRRYVVFHHGVPIARIERLHLTSGELAVGEVEPDVAYQALRPLILAASRSLWSVGFLSSGIAVDSLSRVPLDVLSRAAALELELRDDHGELVPTDFVNIVERPLEWLPPVVFARLRLSPAGEAASLAANPLRSADRDVGPKGKG